MKSPHFKPFVQASRSGLLPTIAAGILASSGMALAQQNVFHRDSAGTGDWGSGNLPWYWQTDNSNKGDPDSNAGVRNDVFIGHNNNTSMTLNGRYYIHRDFTFQSGASSARTIGSSSGGGFSFTRKLENASSATHVFNAPVAIDANSAEITVTNAGVLRFNGSVFTNNNQTFIRGNGTTEFLGAMTQGGSFVKQGTGTLIFGGSADFSGSLFIDQGVVGVSRNLSSNSIEIGAGVQAQTGNTANLRFDSGVSISKNITVKNFGTGAGDRILEFANPSGTAELAGTLALEKNLGISGTGTGLIAGTISGTGGLTKTGGGTLTLSNTHSYTGQTQVNGGTLILNGSTHANSAVSVASGATLGGNGTVNGTLATTGSISPGTASGTDTLKSGSVTWTGNATSSVATDWKFNLGAGNASDKLQITGNFNKPSGTAFWFDFMNSSITGLFDLVTWTGTTNFAASDFKYTNLGTGFSGTFSIVGGNTLRFTAIPEPTTALAGLLLTAGLLRRRRA